MINRSFPLALSLILSTASLAQPLYKWVEPDGAITFSPDKPATGVSYETLIRPGVENLESADGTHSGSTSHATTRSHVKSVTVRDNSQSNSKVSADEYAETNGNSSPGPGVAPIITPVGAPVVAPANAIQQATPPDPVQSDNDWKEPSPRLALRKRQHCDDLQKRVVSLERRLRSYLTPEDMDNTVIHMARYQRSFDLYCEQ